MAVAIELEVSTRIMKYGFDGAGHCAGSGERHDVGSAADAVVAQRTAASNISRVGKMILG